MISQRWCEAFEHARGRWIALVFVGVWFPSGPMHAAPDTTTVTVTTITTNKTDTTSTTTVVADAPADDPCPAKPSEASRQRAATDDQRPSSWGIYMGDSVIVGPSGHRFRAWNELHFMVQVAPRWSVGLATGFSLGDWKGRSPTGERRDVSASYTGFRAGFAFVHRKRLDVGIDGFIGGGRICLSSGQKDSKGHVICDENPWMLVTSPRIYANVRLGRLVRLGLAGGYRFVSRRRLGPDDDMKFSGPFVGATFDLGGWE